jgi:hypothetical protein
METKNRNPSVENTAKEENVQDSKQDIVGLRHRQLSVSGSGQR